MLEYNQILIAAAIGMVILLFLALSLFLLLRGIYLKLNGETPSIFAGRPAMFIMLIHCFALLLICVMFYASYIEPASLYANLSSLRFERVTNKIRVSLIADIDWPRCRMKPSKIVDAVNRFEPDIVLFGGDIAAEPDFESLSNELKRISCPQKFGVIGNASPSDDTAFFAATGITLLDDRFTNLTLNGTNVYLLGIPWFGSDCRRYAPFPEGSVRILLTHTPDFVDNAKAAGFDLYLAAHTHGGQICFPFAPNLFVPGGMEYKYPRGVFDIGDMKVVISKGIGMAGGFAPKMRFFCLPEVYNIELHPDNK